MEICSNGRLLTRECNRANQRIMDCLKKQNATNQERELFRSKSYKDWWIGSFNLWIFKCGFDGCKNKYVIRMKIGVIERAVRFLYSLFFNKKVNDEELGVSTRQSKRKGESWMMENCWTLYLGKLQLYNAENYLNFLLFLIIHYLYNVQICI